MTYLILKYEGHTAPYNTLQANDQTETHKQIIFSKCLLRHGVLRVLVSFCVLVFVRAI